VGGFTPFQPQTLPLAGGTITGSLTVDGTVTAVGGLAGPQTDLMTQLASTGAAGFALQDATPTIISWTAPSDGNMHRVLLNTIIHVTSAQTGGAVTITHVAPDGTSSTDTPFAGGLGTGITKPAAIGNGMFPVEAGSTVTVAQSSAQTAGAATLWAELWGS
jgi:hypothetical protein